jgi:GT2 family glycosyltransferase/tetratricopeptide (TPR) repeat protein/glycosyltransferase involved in cell wall biosynthesis
LTAGEFKTALHTIFPHAVFYAQRALIGSAMILAGPGQDGVTFERRSDAYIDAANGLPRAPYLVGVASAAPLDAYAHSLYIDLTRTAHLLTSRFGGPQPEQRLPALESEITSLRGELAQRDTTLALAESRAVEAEARAVAGAARENALQAELEKQQIVSRELSRQRDAAGLAAAEAVHEEIAELRKLLASAQVAAEGQAQQAETTRRELEQVYEALSDARKRADENSATLEHTRGELREALVLIERQRQEYELLTIDRRAPRTGRVQLLPFRAGRSGGGRRVGREIRAGDRFARARNWTAAAYHYRRALGRAPHLVAMWVQYGHVLKEAGDLAGAESAYRRALTLDGSVADTHLQLGHLLKLRERFDEAVAAYAKALQLSPDLQDARRELQAIAIRSQDQGDAARDARDWAGAARYYRRVVGAQPELTSIWVQLGHALKEQGDHRGAEDAYRHAISLDASTADTHLQLGHLLKLQARRAQAIEAYATAIRLDPDLTAAHDALRALVGYSPSETERALLINGKAEGSPAAAHSGVKPNGFDGGSALPNGAGHPLVRDVMAGPEARYGALFGEASRKSDGARDIIWLGVIDWHFRIQRPQHLAANLADSGARIFYISLVFEPADERGRFRIVESPHLGVFEIRLRLWHGAADSLYRGFSDATVRELQLALDELLLALGITAPIMLVEYPAWYKVAYGVPGATIVYDCLDLATGFNNAPATLAAEEKDILAGADLVIAASRPLVDHIAQYRPSVLIRNAADTDFFAEGFTDRPIGDRPVIGYFGAIAEWFEIDWIEHCAAARPDWQFRLIGRTDGCDISRAAKLPNVEFLGEQPYQELPRALREFDVALIPFKLIDLTRCTNPVKLYEYMSAGKPAVASPMPEVTDVTDLAYIAEDAAAFVERIAQALRDDTPALRRKRQAWAREHTWAGRARQMAEVIETSFSPVSVIVLTYNNWDYTAACLSSLRIWSDYPRLEIIVVDNASTDGTREKLLELARHDRRLRVTLNETNLGFAAGNNVGIRAATGEYVVLLNNDTFVTRGWVRDLIRPMQLDSTIGLVGPLTNNIGNEQKVRLVYGPMAEMQSQARSFIRERLRRRVETDNLAFFCVAIRKSVIDRVGLLDEAYGIGFFEDDDYCRRVKQAGYRMVIADDVFVHHHLSASFDTLGAEAAELMARNRALFEKRWGPWTPHQYRPEPGFG